MLTIQPFLHSLRTRLSLMVFAGMLLLSTIVVLGVYTLTFEDAEHDAQQQVGELLDAMKYSAAIAAYASDKGIADDVLRGIILSSFVATVHISNGKDLEIKRDKFPNVLPDLKIQRDLISPFDELEKVGILEASLYLPEIHLRAAASAKKMAIILSGAVVLPTLIFWLVISRIISEPLLILSKQLGTIMPGTNQRLFAPSHSEHDEFATLTNNINNLLDTVSISISKERHLRMRIETMEQQYETIFTQASTGMALLDTNGHCLIANPAVSQLFESGEAQVEGVFCLLKNWESWLFFEPNDFRQLLKDAVNCHTLQSQDLRLLHRKKNQSQYWVQVQISCHTHEKRTTVVECLFMDISNRKQLEDEARFQSHHDPLTQLLNRRGLEARLTLNYYGREKDKAVLFLLDLDRFKIINDQWGHLAGDKVLVEITRRMKSMVRDFDLIARLGGDEFVIFLSAHPDEANLHNFLHRMINQISQDIQLDEHISDYVGVSIGIAQYPEDGVKFSELLKKADTAMYEVKNHGRNGYCIHNPEKLSPVLLARCTE